MAQFKLFFRTFLSHSLLEVHSPPGDQLWNVESLSAFFISPWSKKSSPSPPFLSRDFFPEAWLEKLENTATNCPVQWRGTEDGREINFPLYSTQILTLVTRSLKATRP
jgi:hypothetical protein